MLDPLTTDQAVAGKQKSRQLRIMITCSRVHIWRKHLCSS